MHNSLIHLSLFTGSARVSPRAEVTQEVISQVQEAILTKEPIADWRIYRLPPTKNGGEGFDLYTNNKHFVRGFLAITPESDAQMWEYASKSKPLPGAIINRPLTTPWLATTPIMDDYDNDISGFSEKLVEAGDLERCVAWALIDIWEANK